MLDTTAPAPPRRGTSTINEELDQIIKETGALTPDQLADLITDDQVLGWPETDQSPCANPVGLWVLTQLQSMGIPAVAYSWSNHFSVYDTSLWLLAEAPVPEHHTMYTLACQVNDLQRPALTWRGTNHT